MFRVPKSLIQQLDTKAWNATSLEARDIKIKITKIDIPVSYATAFEGEIIRRGDMQVEVDGSRVDCFELVQTKEAERRNCLQCFELFFVASAQHNNRLELFDGFLWNAL